MGPLLDTSIGLVMLYLLLSGAVSSVQELVAQLLGLRSSVLKRGIAQLLRDEKLRAEFLRHPMIANLSSSNEGKIAADRKWYKRSHGPSYMSSRTFARVVMDLLQTRGERLLPPGQAQTESNTEWNFPAIRAALQELSPSLAKSLEILIRASADRVDRFEGQLESWFDTTMDRASGWYKRKSQALGFGISLVVVGILNADSIYVARTLWSDAELRDALTAQAQSYVADTVRIAADAQPTPIADSGAQPPNDSASEGELASTDFTVIGDELEALRITKTALDRLELPIGWHDAALPPTTGSWFVKIFGLLISVMAASLGAPFWFQLLSRLISVRGSGSTPARSATEPDRPATA